jgi:hypothetical protein
VSARSVEGPATNDNEHSKSLTVIEISHVEFYLFAIATISTAAAVSVVARRSTMVVTGWGAMVVSRVVFRSRVRGAGAVSFTHGHSLFFRNMTNLCFLRGSEGAAKEPRWLTADSWTLLLIGLYVGTCRVEIRHFVCAHPQHNFRATTQKLSIDH